MATIDKKGCKNRQYLKGVIKRFNGKACIVPVPPCGRLLRKFKKEREVENMKSTVKCNNDYMPDYIESTNTMSRKELANMLLDIRKDFVEESIERGESSREDPIVKDILSMQKYE